MGIDPLPSCDVIDSKECIAVRCLRKLKTRIPALDPPNWWENFVKITEPITLTQEKLFFHTFDLLENTFCALAKNVPSKTGKSVCVNPSQVVVPTALPALGIEIVFILEGSLAAQASPPGLGGMCGSTIWGSPHDPVLAPLHGRYRSHLSSSPLCSFQAEGSSRWFTCTLCCQDTEWCKSSWQLHAGAPQG